MPTRPVTEESRLLNRELSWVELDARVLDLAADAAQPLLERVKFCSIFSSNLDEFFMVRVAGLMGQEASGFARPLGRRADAGARRSPRIRARVTELTAAPGEALEARSPPRARGRGDRDRDDRGVRERRSSQRLGAVFSRDIYPVLTPLAVGSGQPFPYISGLSLSLGVLAVDPDTGEERFARVKVPEGLDRFVDTGRRLVPLEAVIAHFLPMLFPGMEIAERAVFRVTRDADFEVSDDADDLLEAVESELRRRRFGDVDPRSRSRAPHPRRCGTGFARGSAPAEDQMYEIEGLARPRRPDAADPARPAGSEGRAVGPGHAAASARASRTPSRFFDEIRRGDILVHQPYESFRASFEAFAAAAAADPDVIAMKTAVYRTIRRQRSRLCADRLRRGGQAVGLPRRAEGAFRRAPQHRVVARAGAGGRARRPRVPGPEDPREDDARRPPRGGRPPALRPHRHRQLQRLDRAALRGRRASSRPTRRSPRTSPTSSTT